MIDNILDNIEIDMKKCFNNFIINVNKIRTGRISVSLLDNISVKYYNNISLLKHISNITLENNNTLKVSVFDPQIIPIICKTILKSDLGVNPNVVGNDIKVIFPSLTEEKKFFLKKILHNETEKHKIIIRNIRRIYNDKFKKLLKCKEINKNDEKRIKKIIQKLTNKYIEKIQSICVNKEYEILKF